MAENQILAALQIESNEVRLLVGEVFNTRLNTLKKETVACKGLDGIRIVDQKAVASAIRQAVDSASAHLGVPIESVLLAIPAYRFKKETRTFSKVIDSGDGRIKADDIKDMYHKALTVNVGSDIVVANVACNVYKTNGITYRKLPVGEQCDVLEADIDLLCCDKLTAYDYVTVVEQAGLKVLDICLDNYALAKEAALFEQTMRNYVLSIQFEKQHTLFSIIYDGKIVTSENEAIGYDSLAKAIAQRYSLPENIAVKQLMKHGRLAQKEFTNRPVYMWTANQVTNMINDYDLHETIKDTADYIAKDFQALCEPILNQENVTVMVSGDGVEIEGVDRLLAERFNKPVKCYYPETLGARGAKWAVPLGLFYSYIDSQIGPDSNESSLDVTAYTAHLNSRVNHTNHEEGFTSRLKNMLFNNQKNS